MKTIWLDLAAMGLIVLAVTNTVELGDAFQISIPVSSTKHSKERKILNSVITTRTTSTTSSLSSSSSSTDVSASERFQALLRDLQIENVPLLGCDTDEVHTFSAAMWTTLAEMNESDVGQRACLVLENIPMSTLTAFTNDFFILKDQERLMADLPELRRISVSVLGWNAGPALVLETANRTPEEIAARTTPARRTYNEYACTAALRTFVERMVIGLQACPYTTSVDVAATGLEAKGVAPGPVAYRYSPTDDVCGALAATWTGVCELLSYDEQQLSTIVLSLPGIAEGVDPTAHDRFSAVSELVSRNLCLLKGDDHFGLVHFHPAYDRNKINPVDMPAYGHLPPTSWLKPMMKAPSQIAKYKHVVDGLTHDDFRLSDYQRRSPHTAINILRTSQLNAAVGPRSIIDLDLGNGRVEKASGLTTYCRNAMRMIEVGREGLQKDLDEEIRVSNTP